MADGRGPTPNGEKKELVFLPKLVFSPKQIKNKKYLVTNRIKKTQVQQKIQNKVQRGSLFIIEWASALVPPTLFSWLE